MYEVNDHSNVLQCACISVSLCLWKLTECIYNLQAYNLNSTDFVHVLDMYDNIMHVYIASKPLSMYLPFSPVVNDQLW